VWTEYFLWMSVDCIFPISGCGLYISHEWACTECFLWMSRMLAHSVLQSVGTCYGSLPSLRCLPPVAATLGTKAAKH
jgi:hypothetical protein